MKNSTSHILASQYCCKYWHQLLILLCVSRLEVYSRDTLQSDDFIGRVEMKLPAKSFSGAMKVSVTEGFYRCYFAVAPGGQERGDLRRTSRRFGQHHTQLAPYIFDALFCVFSVFLKSNG